MEHKLKRYSYSTVDYGIYSLLGEKYRMGRIEIFDNQNYSGYAIGEGNYCMPFEAASEFADFIENLTTDLPIQINIGSVDECVEGCAKELGIDKEKLTDLETKREYYRQKYDK